MQTQGREIGEIKRELKDVATKMTEVATILPHLVTKEHCAEARGDTVRKMKDRMDGKREITGVNMTLPELWEKAAKFATEEKKPAQLPPVRGAAYYIKLTAAIVSLIGVLLGMTTFVVKTFQRQERTDRVLRTLIENQQRQLQQQQAPPAPPPQLEVATP
jgi:hypothetical protein